MLEGLPLCGGCAAREKLAMSGLGESFLLAAGCAARENLPNSETRDSCAFPIRPRGLVSFGQHTDQFAGTFAPAGRGTGLAAVYGAVHAAYVLLCAAAGHAAAVGRRPGPGSHRDLDP